MSTARPLRTALLSGAAAAFVFACSAFGSDQESDDNQFREDVIWCEDALSRLADCCPGFAVTNVVCNHYYARNSGCGSTTTTRTDPTLTTAESACIARTSCEALVTTGVCTRAAAAAAPHTVTTTDTFDASFPKTTGTARGPAVCP